jgi:hypothetical protein
MPWPISTPPEPTRTRPFSSKASIATESGLSIRLCGSALESEARLRDRGAGLLHRADNAVVDAAAAVRVERRDDVSRLGFRFRSNAAAETGMPDGQ